MNELTSAFCSKTHGLHEEHVLKDIIPCCFDARVAEFQKENNRQWVTLEEAIQDRDDHIQAI